MNAKVESDTVTGKCDNGLKPPLTYFFGMKTMSILMEKYQFLTTKHVRYPVENGEVENGNQTSD